MKGNKPLLLVSLFINQIKSNQGISPLTFSFFCLTTSSSLSCQLKREVERYAKRRESTEQPTLKHSLGSKWILQNRILFKEKKNLHTSRGQSQLKISLLHTPKSAQRPRSHPPNLHSFNVCVWQRIFCCQNSDFRH